MATDVVYDTELEASPEPVASPDETIQALQDSTQASDTSEIPEKYQGKSLKEVVEMHQAAEKVIGKHSNEVGELRQLVDGYIKEQSSVQQPTTAEDNAVEEADFFIDPATAVDQRVASHPAVQRALEASQNLERQTAAARLQQAHPDAPEITNDPEFAKWVTASPIRKELFVRADAEYDFAAAEELLSGFKARKNLAKEAASVDEASRKSQLRKADTGSAKGSASGPTKRKLRRVDIIRLMRDDPDRYAELAGEIQKAYAEGRVV